MAYGDFKDLPRRIAADEVLRDKVFNIVKNPRYDGYQRFCFNDLYFFDKNSSGSGFKSEIMPNQELVGELHKSIIRKFEK